MNEVAFDTRTVDTSAQLEYWADHVCKAFTRLEIDKISSNQYQGFIGQLNQRWYGQIAIASAKAQDSVVQLTRSGIAEASEEMLLLHLQYRGTSQISHAGTSMSLNRGDIELCDCTKPYRLDLQQAASGIHEMLVLKIPMAVMAARVANVHELGGAFIPASSNLGNLVSQFVINVWENREGIEEDAAAKLGEQIIDLVCLALDKGALQGVEDTPTRTGHLISMKRFIENHLTDSGLAPATVAAAACISLRYAHQLFESEKLTIASYIMERRLTNCELMLTAPQHTHLSISEIAFLWGFKDASHFGHVFKRRYSMSPREYRAHNC